MPRVSPGAAAVETARPGPGTGPLSFYVPKPGAELAEPRVSGGVDVRRFPAAEVVGQAAGEVRDAAARALGVAALPWGDSRGRESGLWTSPLYTPTAGVGHREGPVPTITVTPGSVRIAHPNVARAERAAQRAVERRRAAVAAEAASIASEASAAHLAAAVALLGADLGPEVDSPAVSFRDAGSAPVSVREWLDAADERGRQVTGFSRKSRARMVERLSSLDWRPMLADGRLGMVTLTYGRNWEGVVPRGEVAKAHLSAFRRRFRDDWGKPLRAAWKLEFQDRGAPHFHLLMGIPEGTDRRGRDWRRWFSDTWASIAAKGLPEQEREHVRWFHSQDRTCLNFAEGDRMQDPRRVGVYFAKHGLWATKEYQNRAPALWQGTGNGPGRFWGYWSLDVVTAGVEVTEGQAVDAARLLRRVAAAGPPRCAAPVERWVYDKVSDSSRKRVVPCDTCTARGVKTTVPPMRRQATYRPSLDTSTGELRPGRRSSGRRLGRMPGTWGFLAVNDGPGTAMAIARVIGPPPPRPEPFRPLAGL